MMWHVGVLLLTAITTTQEEPLTSPTTAVSPPQSTPTVQPQLELKAPAPKKRVIEAFTGKVTKNRVRLRLAPSLDSHVYKELEKDESLLVTGEVDDFFAVQPPKEVTGYVFRTYVLDGIVEGSHINVRLEPGVSAPILCQLNTGDKVEGTIAANNKWLQIALPAESRFYVAKEFVTKIGDKSLFTSLEAQTTSLMKSLDELEVAIEWELQKHFNEIAVAPLASKLNHIISHNENLPKHIARAKELLNHMQETYLQKSCASPVPQKVMKEQAPTPIAASDTPKKSSGSIVDWAQKEHALLQEALDSREISTEEQFYTNDLKKAKVIRGVVKPYDRVVRNRPGDFLLFDQKSGLPIGCLYSTQCDLQSLIGQEVAVVASPRPNNNFAFPAYFVHKSQ